MKTAARLALMSFVIAAAFTGSGRSVDPAVASSHDKIDSTFTTGPYELLLPKWADDYTIDLLEWLTDVGAAPGSYPGIDPDAFLGAAVHAADISVDEAGTVAAAATGLGFEDRQQLSASPLSALFRRGLACVRRVHTVARASGHVPHRQADLERQSPHRVSRPEPRC